MPCCVCGVLGHLAPVQRCARVACVVLRMRCPGPPDCCSLVCLFCVLCGVCGVTRGETRACCVVWLLRCPGPLGSCTPVCTLSVRCCVCGVLRHWAPVHPWARSVCGVACAVSWATWLLFTGLLAWRVWCCVSGVWGHLAPVHRCACSVCCAVCVVSPVVTHVLVVLCCLCGALGHLAPVPQCARSVCGVVCEVSWATWLLFSGVLARCVVRCVRLPGPLGPSSPVCSCGVCCVAC